MKNPREVLADRPLSQCRSQLARPRRRSPGSLLATDRWSWGCLSSHWSDEDLARSTGSGQPPSKTRSAPRGSRPRSSSSPPWCAPRLGCSRQFHPWWTFWVFCKVVLNSGYFVDISQYLRCKPCYIWRKVLDCWEARDGGFLADCLGVGGNYSPLSIYMQGLYFQFWLHFVFFFSHNDPNIDQYSLNEHCPESFYLPPLLNGQSGPFLDVKNIWQCHNQVPINSDDKNDFSSW